MDKNPYLWIQFDSVQQYVDTVKINFEHAPSMMEVYCWFNHWYVTQMVFVKGKSVEIHMDTLPCGTMYIKMFNSKKNNCKEGKCISINQIKFTTPMKKIVMNKCDDSDDGNELQKIYQEPI